MKDRKSFYEMSIRRQTQIIVFGVLALFVILCGLISISTRQLIYKNEDEHMQVTALRLRDQIELVYEKMSNFCINIGEDEAVQMFMKSDYSELSATLEGATECLTKHKVLDPMIEDISLVNDRIHYSNVYRNEELDEIRQQVGGVPFRWLGVRSHSFSSAFHKPDMLVYAGDITVGAENIGTIVISVDSAAVYEEKDGEISQTYFLADEEGILLPFGLSVETARKAYRIFEESGWKEQLEQDGYYIRCYYFERMGCWLVSVLSLKNIGMEATQIQLLIWGCVLQAAAFCFAFFFLITKGIVRPLHQLGETIRQIRQSHQRGLDAELDLKGCAEITELGYEFSGMLEDIEKLNRKIFQSATDLYELKVQKQEAELAYLRSQVDPHFLYNTLEVVRKMALKKDAPEIAQMALDMGNIFRYNAKGGDEVSLEEEISIIKSYIRIQQLRFAGKIEVFYFISEDVLQLKVMKMLLQPIVENSIFHGLEPKSGKGSLYIGARIEEEMLVIMVKDDGVGIEREGLKEIQKELSQEKADTSKHVGTLNTNARIRLFYGKKYGVSIESCVEDGTTVILRLPVRPM